MPFGRRSVGAINLAVIVVMLITWGFHPVITVIPCGLKDLISLCILSKYLVSTLSFECFIVTLGSEGPTTTHCGDLVGFLVSESSTSFVYVQLVGGGDGRLEGLPDDADFAGGVLEFRDIFQCSV